MTGLTVLNRTIRIVVGIILLYLVQGPAGVGDFTMQAFGLYGVVTGLLGTGFL